MIKRAVLCLKDIYEPAKLCLSKCYFLWNDEMRILKNSGPVVLSFLVVLYESYVQNLEHKAINETLTLNMVPKAYVQYVDDTYGDPDLENSLREFQKILNKQDKQFTLQ